MRTCSARTEGYLFNIIISKNLLLRLLPACISRASFLMWMYGEAGAKRVVNGGGLFPEHEEDSVRGTK